MKGKIPLFWWSETRLMNKARENYGDLLSWFLVKEISRRPVEWVHPKKKPWYRKKRKHYLVIGSILHHATEKSIVWGSGIIDMSHPVPAASFLAVRGPRTRNYLINRGYTCPEIFGDPALLLPQFYSPIIEKKYKLGIVPHYHDYQIVKERYEGEVEVLVVDIMTMRIEEVTDKILSCEQVISSSLHGIIVSHAYEIPCVWVKFSNRLFGDGVKFLDYLESVQLPVYEPSFLAEKLPVEELETLLRKNPALPEQAIVNDLQNGLLNSCPFR
ncbi:polysaccharide pyruvyl transferase family protein [Salinimicrobium flavum]|uniref:Polysaccharide pyruvyl transferase family protein n=1 Tax=Salinimicrobium flavum TaxID=1737065 RepID=A0ABW5IXZ6_9FLAO